MRELDRGGADAGNRTPGSAATVMVLCSAGQRYPAYCAKPMQPGGHRERRAEGELQDEEERQPAADPRAVHRAQVAHRAAGLRQRGAELRPDQAVAHDEQCAEHPAQHRLRPVHRRDHQRDGDERPDADHVDHVQRGRVPEADAADEAAITGRVGAGNGVGIRRAASDEILLVRALAPPV